MTAWAIALGFLALVVLFAVAWHRVVGPRSEEQRALEDLEQMRAINRPRKRRP